MSTTDRFVCIGEAGLGNERSQVTHSMAMFRGDAYVGVTHPRGEGPDDAARILRFDPDTCEWIEVYRSPLVASDERAVARDVFRDADRHQQGLKGKLQVGEVPRDRGYRCMAVANSGAGEVLYVGSLCHWGSQLLRSTDGKQFDVITEPGLGNPNVLSFRAIVPFRDKLFVSPVGSVDKEVMDRNFGDVARLYVTDDPESDSWSEAMPEGFGDRDNKSVFAMTEFNGFLYAGTGNPGTGFQIWKTDAAGKPPYRWQLVVRDGAHRFNLNETATTMVVFDDCLYVGSGVPGLGYDKVNDIGPVAAELIRIHPDDSWELVVGVPRFSPQGLKVPLSMRGPGLDDPYNSIFWSMAAHNGMLYVGTHQWESWDAALSGRPEMRGGFQLWATADMENWERFTMDGFGDPYSIGVRTLLSTPYGLLVGTSTHREIEKIWMRRNGVRGHPGKGGLSVWCGE